MIIESPVTLAATGIWKTFGSLFPVILVATGIQGLFPHPTWFVSAGMFQLSLSQKYLAGRMSLSG